MRLALFIAAGFITGAIVAIGLIVYGEPEKDPVSAQAAMKATAQPEAPTADRKPLPDTQIKHPAVVDVTLHRLDEITALLNRLSRMPRNPETPPVALVLHGDEIQFFTREHYDEYRDLVELAGRLDASKAIEVKVCRTKMRMMDIQEDDLPSFVETVPFGPGEVLWLDYQGYEVYTAF